MKKIEEITFIVNGQKCSYKLYKYIEEAERKIKVPAEIGEVTLQMGYKYVDTKIKVTKYALHQEFEVNGEYQDKIVCETESYTTILTILKEILMDYIKTIEKYRTPMN